MRLLPYLLAATLLATPAFAQEALMVDRNVAPPPLEHEFGPQPFIPAPDVVIADHLDVASQAHTDFEEINAGDTVGAFRFLCGPAHVNTDDPLVYPGQRGRSHGHQNYGNTGMRFDSTYATFRTSGDSTCQDILNRSGYWQPAMYNGNDMVILPDWVTIYYKRFPKSRPQCTPGNPLYAGRCVGTPNGLHYIFGRDMVTGLEPTGASRWKCVYNYDRNNGVFDNLVDAAKSCDGLPQDGRLQIGNTLNAPDCWDGKNLDSPNHRSHTANFLYDGDTGRTACPKTHPYVIPAYTATAWWTVDATLDRSGEWHPGKKTWHMSSDLMPGMAPKLPGSTSHFDYAEAWEESIKKIWTDNCIDRGLSCGGGDLGNGTILRQENPSVSPDKVPARAPVLRPKMANEASTVRLRAPQ